MNDDRSRTFTWHDPMLTAAGSVGRTGLEFLQGIIDGSIPPPPIQFTLGFELIHVEDGAASFRLTPAEYHYNPMASFHGGVTCTLLDSAMGCAVMSTLDAKTAYTTADLNVHLTRAITARTGPVTAEAKIIHRGSRMMTAEGTLLDEKRRILAHATCTCLLLDRPTS